MSAPTVYSLPDIGFEQVSFDLIVPGNANQMESRRTERYLSGTPFWSAKYSSTWLDFRDYGKADAFIRRVLSRGGVFKAHDLFRPRPIEFGQTPLTWTLDLTQIVDARQVKVSGVANNAQFREGDYVAFKMSDLTVSLHSIEADVQADSSGAVTLSIDPSLDTQNFTVAAVPIFEKPYCLMQPSDWSASKSWSSRNPSWSAQEVFFYEPA